MAGTKEGGRKAAATNKRKYGKGFYAEIGKIGGSHGHVGGFNSDKVGADGLTGWQRAAIAGAKGGSISRRGKDTYKKRAVLEQERSEQAKRELAEAE